jgi:hypothetical protein
MLDPVPAYLNCPECGTSVSAAAIAAHACDDRLRREHNDRTASAQVAELEADIRSFLQSPRGRFELFYAQRTRRRAS